MTVRFSTTGTGKRALKISLTAKGNQLGQALKSKVDGAQART